jgi:GNAT superfamily N-acetyltransferase
VSIHIRPFTLDDFAQVVPLMNLIHPQYPSTVEEQLEWEARRDPTHKIGRWVAEQDGQILAMGQYGQYFDEYHPRKFFIDVRVHPEHRRQGIGTLLYNQVMEELKQHDPMQVRSEVREDLTDGIRFLEKRGFHDAWRRWESRLDVVAFDPTPYVGLEEKLRAEGIEIKSVKELEADPECFHKLHQLDNELMADIPSFGEMVPLTHERFLEIFMNSEQLAHESYFIALHDGEYVGTASLWSSKANSDLHNNLTGVKRPYRHRGIALALKLRCIAFARAHNAQKISTMNDHPNTAMISINQRLGFVREVGWITYAKENL